MNSLRLYGGSTIPEADVLLQRKKTNWPWKYYDNVKDDYPEKLTIFDYTITIAMSNYITAERYKAYYEALDGLNEKYKLIDRQIALEDIYDKEDSSLKCCRNLIIRMGKQKGIALTSATKVLHRKLPKLVPMLDSNVITYYWKILKCASVDKTSPSWMQDAWNNWVDNNDPLPYMRIIGHDVSMNMDIIDKLAIREDISRIRVFESILFQHLIDNKR